MGRWIVQLVPYVQPGVLVAACLLLIVQVSCAFASQAPASQPASIDMIFWEMQSWKPAGGSQRLTLWADGRSEVTVKRFGQPQKTKSGWTVTPAAPYSLYHKSNPLDHEDGRQRFRQAIAAGIAELKAFPPDYVDGGATLVGIRRGGKLEEITVPLFSDPHKPNDKGSENEKRFLAVRKAIGQFENDPIQKDTEH